MMNRFFQILLFLSALALTACVIDTVPLPENSESSAATSPGGANDDFTDDSTNQAESSEGDSAEPSPTAPDDSTQRDDTINLNSIYYSANPIELVGAAGAFSGEGKLRIETTSSWAVEISTTPE